MTNRVAVLEFLCGGGIQSESAQSASSALDGLLQEGWGMLRALCEDLTACGFHVQTCLSSCFENRFPQQMEFLHANGITNHRNNGSWLEAWCELAKAADVTVLIAPELDMHLVKISQHLRALGANLALPSQAWLSVTSDKWSSYSSLATFGIRQPKTVLLSDFLAEPENGTPASGRWILKLRHGTGGVGTKRFHDTNVLKAIATSGISRDQWANWIVQEFIEGRSASLCAIVHGKSIQVLGGMTQDIQWPNEDTSESQSVKYSGGEGPIPCVDFAQLERFANSVLRSVANTPSVSREGYGFGGWIGIDFIIPEGSSNESEWIAIEINSRLTTSYLGYRQWYGSSVARSLVLGGMEVQPLVSYSESPLVRFDA